VGFSSCRQLLDNDFGRLFGCKVRAMKSSFHRQVNRNPWRRRRGVSRNLLLSVVAGLVLASFSVVALLIYLNSSVDPTQQLDIALRLLRKGDGDSSAKIARSIPQSALKKKSDVSKLELLLGIHERKTAEGIEQRKTNIDRNEKAVKHLSKSNDLGFPEGYEGQGHYHLGMALFELFRWDEAGPSLEIAAGRWPQGRMESIERLVDIDLAIEEQDTDAAMTRIEQWRALPRTRIDEEERSNVKEMRVRYARKQYQEADAMLELIPVDSKMRGEAEVIAGRCKKELAKGLSEPDRTNLCRAAQAGLQRVHESAFAPLKVRRQSNLEFGRVQRELGDVSGAISTLSALRMSSLYEIEGIVAGIEEIECLVELGRVTDVADTLHHITDNFGTLEWYQNDWITFDDLRKKLIRLGDELIERSAYSEASEFAKHLPPLCDRIDFLRLTSKCHDRWARQLATNGRNDGSPEMHHRIAAASYGELVMKSLRSPDFTDLVLKAVDGYRLCGDFQESNRYLDTYLQFESREKHPLGLLAKARNFSSMREPSRAIETLQSLMERNANSPLVYDARLEAARLMASNDDYKSAEDLILQNLYFGELKPESPIWKDSLIELGELLYRRGERLQTQASDAIAANPSNAYESLAMLEESYNELVRGVSKIEEGLRRFNKDPRRFQMLYMTAKSYQLASTWPEMLLRENRVANEETMNGWKSQRKELLLQSRNSYRKLREEIVMNWDSTQSSRGLENLLRNSFFGEADLLYEDGEYDDALRAYQDAANRFINEPESLEAMSQIANCQWQLGRLSEARRTLETAKESLQRIPSEKNKRFTEVTSHDRAGWERYFNWQISELQRK
jgi:tetratricopeptide (TPR) repeat protein